MVKGTRVTVRTVLASLAEGATIEAILADFPTLTPEAVRRSLLLRPLRRRKICLCPARPSSPATEMRLKAGPGDAPVGGVPV